MYKTFFKNIQVQFKMERESLQKGFDEIFVYFFLSLSLLSSVCAFILKARPAA